MRLPLLPLALLALCSCGSDQTSAASDASTSDAGAADSNAGCEALQQSGLEVETCSGVVIGKTGEDNLRVYLGIPYAEPPVGQLRFQRARPVPAWDAPFSASDYGSSCLQTPLAFNETSEDCLSLNIWAHRDDQVRPVMVWIYGGGFVLGETAFSTYDGEDFAVDADVVLVTINYRLGALGNLALPELREEDERGATGTAGLSDQLEALRWIKKNARAFGGDPENITVFGESAGALSACALMGSPDADGLFQKAILQSGNCSQFVSAIGDKAPAIRASETIAEDLGCDAGDRLACLRALPGSELAGALPISELLSIVDDPPFLGPAIDGVLLPQAPHERLVSKNAPPRPMIVGSNGNEGFLFTAAEVVLSRSDFRDKIAGPLGDAELAQSIVDLYPFSQYPIAKDAFTAFVGDYIFSCSTYLTAKQSSQETYYYSLEVGPAAAMTPYGAVHAADLPLIFGNFVESAIVPTPLDLARSNNLQQAWGSFARHGKPDYPAVTSWPTLAEGVLALGLEARIENDYLGGRCEALRALGALP